MSNTLYPGTLDGLHAIKVQMVDAYVPLVCYINPKTDKEADAQIGVTGSPLCNEEDTNAACRELSEEISFQTREVMCVKIIETERKYSTFITRVTSGCCSYTQMNNRRDDRSRKCIMLMYGTFEEMTAHFSQVKIPRGTEYISSYIIVHIDIAIEMAQRTGNSCWLWTTKK
jgi:hypothetical protein